MPIYYEYFMKLDSIKRKKNIWLDNSGELRNLNQRHLTSCFV